MQSTVAASAAAWTGVNKRHPRTCGWHTALAGCGLHLLQGGALHSHHFLHLFDAPAGVLQCQDLQEGCTQARHQACHRHTLSRQCPILLAAGMTARLLGHVVVLQQGMMQTQVGVGIH
jgi:hypothetical protein